MKKPDETSKDDVGQEDLLAELAKLRQKLEVQRRVAYAEGLFQGDVTIRTMLESLAEGVVIVDSSGTIVLVNKRTEGLFGYRTEELLGSPLSTLLPARFHTAHDAHVRSYFQSPKTRPMGQGRELVARHKNGREFPVEISLSHLETSGTLLGLAFVTDISQRKAAEHDLQSRNEELDAFAHTVAHDLKGALTPLLGYCQLLTQPDLDLSREVVAVSLDEIVRTGQKMAAVIDALLLLSSVRKEDVEISALDIRTIVDEVLQRLDTEFSGLSGVEIAVAEAFPAALGYAPWVEEVWYNYLSNAIRHGGDPPRIEIGGELRDDGFASFWVRDNGPGIAGEDLEKLFVPYVRRSSSAIGHGLGLSIVKRIVEKLDGEVAAASQAGGGSTFFFTLPESSEAE